MKRFLMCLLCVHTKLYINNRELNLRLFGIFETIVYLLKNLKNKSRPILKNERNEAQM